jgi:predicted SnoaL-like aldol condensation-catalyzing enzyme
MESRKQIAVEFLRLAAGGNPRKAFELFVAKDFKHHNVYFKGDAETLIVAIEEASKKSPNKLFEMHHVLEDGELVAIHSHVQQEKLDVAVMHIFRFRGDKIVELWDFGQQVPEDSPNENGMF